MSSVESMWWTIITAFDKKLFILMHKYMCVKFFFQDFHLDGNERDYYSVARAIYSISLLLLVACKLLLLPSIQHLAYIVSHCSDVIKHVQKVCTTAYCLFSLESFRSQKTCQIKWVQNTSFYYYFLKKIQFFKILY